jgi:hypothetical protein
VVVSDAAVIGIVVIDVATGLAVVVAGGLGGTDALNSVSRSARVSEIVDVFIGVVVTIFPEASTGFPEASVETATVPASVKRSRVRNPKRTAITKRTIGIKIFHISLYSSYHKFESDSLGPWKYAKNKIPAGF